MTIIQNWKPLEAQWNNRLYIVTFLIVKPLYPRATGKNEARLFAEIDFIQVLGKLATMCYKIY